MKKIVKVGSRDSRLAVIQAKMVIASIQQSCPDVDVKLVTMSSFGDKNLDRSIESMGKENLFSDTLESALSYKTIDIAVHSYKDLPINLNKTLPIVALSERENPLEALLLRENCSDNAVIGTSCRRRALQTLKLYPNYTVRDIRGSVPLRLEKMDKGEFDGLILAVAGLKRLGLDGRISKIFSADEIVPSACQGIIAVQGRKNEDYSYLREFDCNTSHIVSEAELTFVKAMNTDGSAYNNGVYAEICGDNVKIVGCSIVGGNRIVKSAISGDLSKAKELAAGLAEKFLEDRNQ